MQPRNIAAVLAILSSILMTANVSAQSRARRGARPAQAPAVVAEPAPTPVEVSEPIVEQPYIAPVVEVTPPPAAAPVDEEPPLAGWHNDLFYITNPGHDFFIVPTGRLQADGYAYVGGNGITSEYTSGSTMAYHRPDVADGFVLKRARIEVAGGFLGRFTYQLGADFTSAAAPIGTDIFVNARVTDSTLVNFQLGQFDAPFTMENRTSDKYFDFMERSLAVRAFGFPNNKELGLMAWGETADRLFYYSVGVFDGDGQNRVNRDGSFDVMGRVFAHPLITTGGLLQNLQLGGSFHYGYRNASTDYAYNAMTTQAGWTFFNPQVAGGMNPMTVVADASQLGVAGELDLPIDRFDLRAEFIYRHNNTREMAAASSAPTSLPGEALRYGDISGIGYYVQVGYWLWGTPGVNGRPGYQNPPDLKLNRPDPQTLPMGLQAVARFDAVNFHYNGGARQAGMGATSADGLYAVYAAEFGLNYWATKHVRFSVNYLQYFFPNQAAAGATATADNDHAKGPHNNASGFGEVTMRVGLAL